MRPKWAGSGRAYHMCPASVVSVSTCHLVPRVSCVSSRLAFGLFSAEFSRLARSQLANGAPRALSAPPESAEERVAPNCRARRPSQRPVRIEHTNRVGRRPSAIPRPPLQCVAAGPRIAHSCGRSQIPPTEARAWCRPLRMRRTCHRLACVLLVAAPALQSWRRRAVCVAIPMATSGGRSAKARKSAARPKPVARCVCLGLARAVRAESGIFLIPT